LALRSKLLRLPRSLSTIQSFHFSAGRVLFWPDGGRVWVLNETAAFIWGFLEVDMEYCTAESEFAVAFAVPPEMAKSAIKTAVSGFSAQGLLAGGSPQPSACDVSFHFSAHGPYLPERLHWPFTESFGMAGHYFFICAEDPMLGESLLSIIRSSMCDPLFCEGKKTSLAAKANLTNKDCWDIYADGRLCFWAIRRISVVPTLMTLIFWRISEYLQNCMLFHAAVLVRDGQALMLPAVSGSGKTTLTALLAAKGWTFFSDELAPIDPETGKILPLAMPMSIKSGSVSILLKDYPQLAAYPTWHRLDGKWVRYLPPPERNFPKRLQSAGVHKIVFPEFHEHKKQFFESLDKAVALELLAETGSSKRALRESDVKIMIDIVERADCYRLVFLNTDYAIKTIEELFAR
jgi:hypothetical protein